MEKRVFNFGAGPAVLPVSVLEEAQDHLLSVPGVGIGPLEISHRSPWFEDVIETAERNLRALLGLPANYHVLFVPGGARLQFSMVPIHYLRGSGKLAQYIVTGYWAEMAAAEAQREGKVDWAWHGKAERFTRAPAPKDLRIDPQAAYVHMTSNETIQGVQFTETPDTGSIPLICDASSDILSRPIPVDRYAMIYAGAQKNLGPAGVTLVLLRQDLLDRSRKDEHSMLNYHVFAESKSLFNTPAVFAIYVVMLVTRWLMDEIGGLDRMAAINRQKAELLYDAIDRSGGFYRGHACPDSRSRMNVTWRLATEDLEKRFIAEAESRGLSGLKGHRAVGGIRASIYNAMTIEGVKALRDFMADFAARHAT